ncbi:FAD-dependent oxidoreductase [Allonocardiopsis opalescens]|uniref:NADPH-dependent 2,4-dienoyl-CoA reductase/sulfur reductase-like enzyme n=1 Tax=Allonocardiopsis opalescens TaxID=1144618 RepID=A0A2T0Q6L4_9ACTN|nr:FAD-dependent oxidoreductase [Allonocardiopsis opalescens]PRX99455.1 NADPH-dependent 2,4-dienoyl-CoA reductase/sulfur reductase-like enzyme [Allonocardiopsis opalescens]
MAAERLVVIGGDAGGMSAASQARRRRGPEDLEIVAIERGRYTSYSACGIPYFIGGAVTSTNELIARAPEVFEKDYAIGVRLHREAVAVDLDARRVTTVELGPGGSGRTIEEPFDQLVVATGAVPNRPALPGAGARGVFGVQTLDDGVAMDAYIEDRRPARAVVVGGGYVGLELAEALVAHDIAVTLVDRAAHPMTSLDPEMGAMVAGALREIGVRVLLEEQVRGFEERDGEVTAVVTRERTIPAELVVLGLGVRPDVRLAAGAGLEIGPSGGIAVDRRMRTSAPGVWAAGDCVQSLHRVSQRPVSIALGTHANKQGRVAGINIGGGYATFPGVVGTAVTKVCGLEVARTGLSSAEADAAGFRYTTAAVESTTRAGYYPGSQPITVKLIAERGAGRLLGGQIVGREGAAKRVDVLATAIWNGMTAEEVLSLDLGYAPPFSPVWDPVLVAARKAAEQV